MKKLALMAGALTLCAVAVSAQAQEKRNAVSLFGNIASSSDVTTSVVNAGYERLVTDKLSVSVTVQHFQTKINGFDSNTLSLGGGATYYVGRPMQASNMLFYGKGVLGVSRSKGSGSTDTGTVFGAFAGLEQPLGESTSLFEELGYQHTSLDSGNLDQLVFNIGLKLRF